MSDSSSRLVPSEPIPSKPTLPDPQPAIAIASDHAGFEQKNALAEWLIAAGYPVTDFGPFDDSRVDYPDYAALVGNAVANRQADLGILICGTGIGMAIAANKVKGIRAAQMTTVEFATLAREHNAANVATLSARYIDLDTNKEIINAFLAASPLGERHADRVAKIGELEVL